MSRDDLVRTNADIVQQVARQIKQHCPTAIVVVVSNPLDVMCWVTKAVTGFPRERVIGMAGVLDTARYRAFLAEALDVSVEDVQAMRSEEHTSELQSRLHLVCRLLLEKKKKI